MTLHTAVRATAMQEALWWVHQRARNKSVYNLTWRLGCSSPIDLDALTVAWQAVVDRHEALRTAVVHHDGVITLSVLPKVTVVPQQIVVDDVGSVPVATMLRLIAEEVHEQTIDLSQAPLARLTLVRVGAMYELLVTVHHVVLDGWAVQLLLADLSTAYAGAQFEDEPVPFHVYAEEIQQTDWEKGLAHWRKTLEGAVSTTVVADRHRYAGSGAAGVTIRYAFSDEAAAGIAALSKQTFATPFAVVLAALEIVLARGGAGPDVAVGVVVANRMTQRDQNLVGYLANLCFARAVVTDADTITDVTTRARDAMWAMLAHQGVPYPVVFGALSETTQAMLSDSAPVMLNYLGPIGNGLRLGDVDLTLHRSPNRAARSDIAIAFWDTSTGHIAEIEYNTGRYDEDTVLALLHDIDAVLATDPGSTVASLDVATRSASGFADHVVAEKPTAGLPDTPVWHQVARAWTGVLGSPPSDPDEDFFTAGGRSLKVMQLAATLDVETGARLDMVDWLAQPTPRRIVAQFESDSAPVATTLTTLRDGDGPHLHLVHGAGGSARDYLALAEALPDNWKVTASEEREPLPSVPDLAARYLADLGVRPDVLGGWSMGGQIAYEMAATYDTPPALVLLDSAPPVGYPPVVDFTAFAASICMSFEVDADWSLPRVSGDNPGLAARALAAHLGCAGQDVPAAALADRWETYQRHVHAVASYVSSRKINAPAVVVGAVLLDAQLGQWAERLGPAPTLLRLDTDHFGLLRPGFAEQLATAVRGLG